MAEYEYMPFMNLVSNYFDARFNVNEFNVENGVYRWNSMKSGGNYISLFVPDISKDGIEVVGSDTSYGIYRKSVPDDSSRTWYFVFKNTSGVYTNWRTIIGNEESEFKCSTIAMDENGYIKFTRPDLIPSTSYGFKCSDWHVVAWISNGLDDTTRLFIDGLFIGYVGNMKGLAEETYLSRGSTWYYSNNNTKYRFAAIADTAHSDDEVISNSQFLMDYFINNYNPEFVPSVERFLIRDSNNVLYTVENGSIAALEETEITSNLFIEKGFVDIPSSEILKTLINPKIYYWNDIESVPSLKATVQGIPSGTHEIVSDRIRIGHESIYGITSVEALASEGATFLLSFDGGSYMKYDSTSESWTTSDTGMTASELIEIPADIWSSIVNSATYMTLKAMISGTDTVTKVQFNFNNESPITLSESEVVE